MRTNDNNVLSRPPNSFSGQRTTYPTSKRNAKSRNGSLDFAFRFDVGYVVRCPLKEFGGRESTLLSFVRITPEGGTPVVLGESYNVAAIPEVMRGTTRIDKLKDEIDFS